MTGRTFSGWAVRTSHSFDMRTVGPTRRSAIVNWLVAGQYNPRPVMVLATTTDVQIERAWERRDAASGAEVVEVVVTEKTDG